MTTLFMRRLLAVLFVVMTSGVLVDVLCCGLGNTYTKYAFDCLASGLTKSCITVCYVIFLVGAYNLSNRVYSCMNGKPSISDDLATKEHELELMKRENSELEARLLASNKEHSIKIELQHKSHTDQIGKIKSESETSQRESNEKLETLQSEITNAKATIDKLVKDKKILLRQQEREKRDIKTSLEQQFQSQVAQIKESTVKLQKRVLDEHQFHIGCMKDIEDGLSAKMQTTHSNHFVTVHEIGTIEDIPAHIQEQIQENHEQILESWKTELTKEFELEKMAAMDEMKKDYEGHIESMSKIHAKQLKSLKLKLQKQLKKNEEEGASVAVAVKDKNTRDQGIQVELITDQRKEIEDLKMLQLAQELELKTKLTSDKDLLQSQMVAYKNESERRERELIKEIKKKDGQLLELNHKVTGAQQAFALKESHFLDALRQRDNLIFEKEVVMSNAEVEYNSMAQRLQHATDQSQQLSILLGQAKTAAPDCKDCPVLKQSLGMMTTQLDRCKKELDKRSSILDKIVSFQSEYFCCEGGEELDRNESVIDFVEKLIPAKQADLELRDRYCMDEDKSLVDGILEEIRSRDVEIEQLNDAARKLESQVTGLQIKYDKLTADHDSLSKKVVEEAEAASSLKKIGELLDEADVAEDAHNDWEGAIKHLISERDHFHNSYDGSIMHLNMIKSEVEDAHNEVKARDQSLAKMERELEEAKEEVEELKIENTLVFNQVEEANEELEQLRAQLQAP